MIGKLRRWLDPFMLRERETDSIVNAVRTLYRCATLELPRIHIEGKDVTYLADATIPVRKGVIQGGVLSPFLFSVYIDDLLETLDDRLNTKYRIQKK
jgi:hypothetical protein